MLWFASAALVRAFIGIHRKVHFAENDAAEHDKGNGNRDE